MDVADTLGFLVGRWRVERLIDDHRQGVEGSLKGKATLVELPSEPPSERGPGPRIRARYDEDGDLRFGSHVNHAQRSLEYHRLDDAAAVLHFPNGRPFVDLDLRTGAWRSVHLCGEDRYQIATLVMSPDVVQERWWVRGPTKDYDAVTTLTRLDRPPDRT